MKKTPNARCPHCGKEFFSHDANNWENEIDETIYCSRECMRAEGFDDDEIDSSMDGMNYDVDKEDDD